MSYIYIGICILNDTDSWGNLNILISNCWQLTHAYAETSPGYYLTPRNNVSATAIQISVGDWIDYLQTRNDVTATCHVYKTNTTNKRTNVTDNPTSTYNTIINIVLIKNYYIICIRIS